MSENGEIYTAGKNFTLPPALTGWTNSTSVFSFNIFCLKSDIRQIIQVGSQIFPKKEETLLNFVNKCFVQVIYSALILVFCKCFEDSIPREHSKNKKTLVILVHNTERVMVR